jgi:hypothetical protein
VPFAVFRVFAAEAALVHPEGGARAAKRWPGANGERIRHHAMGLASGAPPSRHLVRSYPDVRIRLGRSEALP